jgi:mycothiol synthase
VSAVDDLHPPEGFRVREALVEDATAIAELMNEVTLAEVGLPWTSVEEVRDALTSPGRVPGLADVALTAPDGTFAGYLSFDVSTEPVQVHALAFVPPRFWGRGLSAYLLRLAEERAGEMAASSPEHVALRVSRFTGNEAAARLFTTLGYERVRTFWMMRIGLEEAPPPPRVPEGISIRTFRPGVDEAATHATVAEAFIDHWGAFPAFEEWRHHEIEGEGSAFDPSLWFLAVDGDEVVGAACCRPSSPRMEDTAQVSELAVRRPWRRRGIAQALLQTAFVEFHRRGIPAAELAVDAQNPTGATHLYERAGMSEALGWDVWEKRFEP